jgi:hypothetical protein
MSYYNQPDHEILDRRDRRACRICFCDWPKFDTSEPGAEPGMAVETT